MAVAAGWVRATFAGVAPLTVMVSSALRAEAVVFAFVVTVMVALPVPDIADSVVTHIGFPVKVHAPLVVMVNVLASPATTKLNEAVDTLTVGAVAATWLRATFAGVAPLTLMVSSALRAVVAVFAFAVTVMVALPVPDVDDTVAHDGTPVTVHAPLVVMVNVLASPAAK